MGQIVPFDALGALWALDGLDRAALKMRLEQVRGELARLDESEPEDPEDEGYQAWGDAHEALEDLADEIMDRLEK